jgi:hypothetical protein
MVNTYNYYGLEATNVFRSNGSGYDIVDVHTGVVIGQNWTSPVDCESKAEKTLEQYAVENDSLYW